MVDEGGGIDSIDCEDVRRKKGMEDGVKRLGGPLLTACEETPTGVVLDLDPSSDEGCIVSRCGLLATSRPGLTGDESFWRRMLSAEEKDHFFVICRGLFVSDTGELNSGESSVTACLE